MYLKVDLKVQGGAPQLCLLVYNPHENYRYFTPIHQP